MTPLECVQVRLAAAVLCQDCETISNTPHPYCPACGSQSLLLLARVLNRTEGNPLRQLLASSSPPKGMCEAVTDATV
jgi:hypothetical protein